ncbi:MAG: protein phosphatase 2C domain-containing protein [Marinovum sp.]|nr:protein phosphatase 2C domain-containing protein [Marinovum sp.]
MRLRYSATTHVGHKRKVNEDTILALPDQQIFVVSDGMGGHARGDYASQTVVEAVAMLDPDLAPAQLMPALRDALARAHEVIHAEAEAHSATIGATVVAFLVAQGHFAAFWAGDSRLYRLQNDQIDLLTTDHSVVASYVMAGQMSWDEAEQHPESNAITRAVGVGDVLELDKIRGALVTGDRFLICSDGLTKYATFNMLKRILGKEPIETVAETLLNVALTGGGQDNISIIVIDVL